MACAAAREPAGRPDRGYGLVDDSSEGQEFVLEEQAVNAQQRAAEELVVLYKVLGGGWELYQAAPPIRQPQPAMIAAAGRLPALDSDSGH